MAYFLKKTTLKGRTYLSIVESFYSHEKRGAAHFGGQPAVPALPAAGLPGSDGCGQCLPYLGISGLPHPAGGRCADHGV